PASRPPSHVGEKSAARTPRATRDRTRQGGGCVAVNPTTLGLLAAGGSVGLGAAILIAALAPARPDLLAALTATPAAPSPDRDAPTSKLGGMQTRIETALAATRLTTPD